MCTHTIQEKSGQQNLGDLINLALSTLAEMSTAIRSSRHPL